PVAYYSQKLDAVAQGFPGCLRAVVAAGLLVPQAEKITLGYPMTLRTPHAAQQLLVQKGTQHLTSQRLTHLEVSLLSRTNLKIEQCNSLNPATLLPFPDTDHKLSHDCLQIVQHQEKPRAELSDVPMPNTELELYTDGSARVVEGQRISGFAVTTQFEVLQSALLGPSTSAQAAELIALTRACELTAGQSVNIYTDSKYAFGVCHAAGQLWAERGFITSSGTKVAHGPLILKLLEAIQLPSAVAIIHVRAHQKGNDPTVCGNRLADTASKTASLQPFVVHQMALTSSPSPIPITFIPGPSELS
ncbi:hypothetical protein G0U57_002304, partial [Chelydra serpentina]